MAIGAAALVLSACTPEGGSSAGNASTEESAAPAASAFQELFNGENLDGWLGNKDSYVVEDGMIVIRPEGGGSGGNLYTEKEYGSFIFQFEFQLTPGANNGLGIHTPPEGDAAYLGKEIQILDHTHEKYAEIKPYQKHGSIYGMVAAKTGFLKPVGEWNEEEVRVEGNKIKVTLNGNVIIDADLDEVTKDGTLDGRDHPGLQKTSGHIAFCGHGDVVRFRNIRIQEL